MEERRLVIYNESSFFYCQKLKGELNYVKNY
nr:MAG TPA: hypothetical protein [Caudoviricetes sp.]